MDQQNRTSPKNQLRIGMVGYGGIAGVHLLGYRGIPLYYPDALPPISMQAVCTSRKETAAEAARHGGFAAFYTDLERMLAEQELDVVDITSPNHLHYRQVLQCLEAGVPVYCEKPLALNGLEAEEIARRSEELEVPVGMTFHYRFVPALMEAGRMVESGLLGRVYHYRALYLHSGYQRPERPFSWRTDRSRSGGGAVVDLGAHVIDLIRYLVDEISQVRSAFETFVPRRPDASGRMVDVEVDDAAWVQTRLAGGGFGTIEVSRFATGTLDDLIIEVHGEKGAFRFSLMQPHWLEWYDARSPVERGDHSREEDRQTGRAAETLSSYGGWTRIDTVQKFPGAAVPPGRAVMGWDRLHGESQYRFLRSLTGTDPFKPDAHDGLKTQRILDAVIQSAGSGRWEAVE
ncbi:MAG: Gfo/Idh/MocA family oxidoreductase [Spirochaetales bacterium]|nr:Gfo/Idh/MocA family oxidoreductase [Spirochaetales bacterium]MCF7936980.1 Gfo/Idh/MocA family oxidoreductase [Spirochaetales bacterium]